MLTVNLTTTYQRLELSRIALTSILLQSKLPDRINLWVSKEPYLRDIGISDEAVLEDLITSLPDSRKDLISIRWVANIGPYRKLIPILRESQIDDVIVTADDDIFYGRDWLSNLLASYESNGGMPVASRVRKISYNVIGKKTSYLHWKIINKNIKINGDYIVTFGGGAVLNKSMFLEQDILDDSFLCVAPTADDLWYSKLLQRKNNEVLVVPSLLKELNFVIHDDGLSRHYNWPFASSFFRKIKLHFWNKPIGFLGVNVCNNDVAYNEVEKYFRSKS